MAHLRDGLVRIVETIKEIASVDLIVQPAAGGRFLKLIESVNPTEDETMFYTPDAYKNRLTARRFVPGLDSRDKLVQMLEAVLDHTDRSARSIREWYIAATGDKDVTGLTANCDRAILREALGTSTLASVLGDALNRRLAREYRDVGHWDVWRDLVNIVSADNFRPRRATRFGGYGDLPVVAEGAPYTEAVSPDDEEATYAVSKRGFVETITLEAIKNDDVGLLQRIPQKLNAAAKRTLARFVLNFLRDNPVIYDGLTLFHASHGNLGASPLSAAAVAAARVAMKKQPEPGSGDPIGQGPTFLWTPFELQETGFNLFQRNTNKDKTFVQSLNLEIRPVWYWSDADDWVVSSLNDEMPTLELAFLDGEEVPEIIVQDLPTVGSLFTHDRLSWKIRFIFGATPIDFRGVFKSVVP